MSGFFLVDRSFFMEVVHDLQGTGFKILVDILASSRREVRYPASLAILFATGGMGRASWM